MDEGWERAAILAARNGDGDAFGLLVTRHQELVFRASYLIVRDPQLAEDIAQEAFIRAYRNLRSFREGEPFRPWLVRIATNLALNQVRSRSRRLRLFSRVAVEPRPSVQRPEEIVINRAESHRLWTAIQRLPEPDRIVLQHRYLLDLSERETATALDLPIGTVKSRVHRALARLRGVLEQEDPALLGEAGIHEGVSR